jgi:hypothetical protein
MKQEKKSINSVISGAKKMYKRFPEAKKKLLIIDHPYQTPASS